MPPIPPQLDLRLLPPFEASDWDAVTDAFAHADEVTLGQHWLAQRDPNFRAGHVRAGWIECALWVYAHLDDDDIFNAATEFNQLLCESGDCFEIFLRPAGGSVYYEFHISPENQVLQLRWPDAQAIGSSGGDLRPFLMRSRRLNSQTQINREERNWRVLVGLDWDFLGAHPQTTGASWDFSFGRYDTTRGQKHPVLSSSSPHQRPDFHRQQEWGQLQFEPAHSELIL